MKQSIRFIIIHVKLLNALRQNSFMKWKLISISHSFYTQFHIVNNGAKPWCGFREQETEGKRPSLPGDGKQVLLNTQYGEEEQGGKRKKL